MVVVAQLVERWLVEPDVAGSSPVDHPTVFAWRSSLGKIATIHTTDW